MRHCSCRVIAKYKGKDLTLNLAPNSEQAAPSACVGKRFSALLKGFVFSNLSMSPAVLFENERHLLIYFSGLYSMKPWTEMSIKFPSGSATLVSAKGVPSGRFFILFSGACFLTRSRVSSMLSTWIPK